MVLFFFFQAEDGIRDLVRSRGLGDVYKRQAVPLFPTSAVGNQPLLEHLKTGHAENWIGTPSYLSLIHI